MPTPAQAAVFSSALFADFFEASGVVNFLEPFEWIFSDVNALGTIIGSVHDAFYSSVNTEFIYMQGSGLACCNVDSDLFVLTDINDKNVVVGQTAYGPPLIAVADSDAGQQVNYLNVLPHPIVGSYDATWGRLWEISDQGTLLGPLAFSGGEFRVLLTPVPEPSNVFAILSAVLILFVGRMTIARERAAKNVRHSASPRLEQKRSILIHSYRSATIGSMRIARRAGM
jgi:hypothetical protein